LRKRGRKSGGKSIVFCLLVGQEDFSLGVHEDNGERPVFYPFPACFEEMERRRGKVDNKIGFLVVFYLVCLKRNPMGLSFRENGDEKECQMLVLPLEEVLRKK